MKINDAKLEPMEGWSNFAVTVDKPGLLDSLRIYPTTRRPPGPGEVEVEVCSVGLNFKEVLFALGALPPPPGPLSFGLECAGTVAAVGPDVIGVELGAEVIVLSGPCLSAYVTTHSSLVVPKPKHLSWEQAASLGIALLTAYYSLYKLARLRRGESVLIHAATGGVGLAAVQVAQWLEAEIFATAGSPRKREHLERLGIKHIFDSRSLDFADQIMERTGNQGVDVVLNSLAGDFMKKSLSVLAPFGRFLELGRRDVQANSAIPLGLLEKGGAFFVVNLASSTPGFQEMLGEVMNHIEEGTFKPLPCRFYSLRRAEEAFDVLARAQHVGKVVINLPTRNAAISRDSVPAISLTTTDMSAMMTKRPMLAEGLLSSEGVDVFRRVLFGDHPQIIVSTRSLDQRASATDVPEQPREEPEEDIQIVTHSSHARSESASAYVPPRNDLEGKICGIWEKFLRIKLIGVHDNFFDIGGDSLLAVQLIARMRDGLGIDLSPHSLLDTPTVAGLAEGITQSKQAAPSAAKGQPAAAAALKAPEPPSCVVRIKSGDPSQMLFLVHPAGGHVYNYLALAHSISTPHEIYGIQSEPLARQERPMTVLEDMARFYNAQMRKQQPRGPYLLGGASFGGALAYEMAQQLVAAGEEVGLLFMLDTAGPEVVPKEDLQDADVLSFSLRLGANIPGSMEDLKQLLPDEQIRYFLDRSKKAVPLFPSVSLADARQVLIQSRTNLRAMGNYQPRPYPGYLAFFQASEPDSWFDTRDPPWPRLAQGGSMVQEVPGNHITMNFPPHVQVLGDKLSQFIQDMSSGRISRRG